MRGRADFLIEELRSGLLRGAEADRLLDAMEIGLRRWLGEPASLKSWAHNAELDRLFALAAALSVDPETQLDPREYLREVACVDAQWSVTPAGEILEKLVGREAVEWLLNLEVRLSTGSDDEWRLSKVGSACLLLFDGACVDPTELPNAQTLLRLELFGVVEDRTQHAGSAEFHVTPWGVEVLRSLVAEELSPLGILAESVLDDRGATIVSTGKPAPATAVAERMARYLAHEIRNALAPAQVAFDSMVDALPTPGADERHVRRVRRGIDRVFKVVQDLVQISDLAKRPPERMDLASVVAEARAALNGNGTHVRIADATTGSIVGHRDRIVLALTNLLRNAVQAHASQIEVRIAEMTTTVEVRVEDDGPGVPVEHRESVFTMGFSLRGDGSGQGLTLVREVMREHDGEVRCESSPSGGAVFVLSFPKAEA